MLKSVGATLVGIVMMVAGGVRTAAEPVAQAEPPVDRVLGERSATLMLDYFRELAAPLPAKEHTPATRQQWEARRSELRRQLWHSLGNYPLENRAAPQPQVTGRLDHGDHVVEKIVYESLPGLFVTALVYVPKNVAGRAPAVIYCNGHWPMAKTEPVIQRCCLGLVKQGYVVFCQDVIGTGERQAPPGSPHPEYHGNYRGAAVGIVDRSLLGYVMYECLRAMDYLETRPDVDAKRVFCTGASGGGEQSLYFPALDDRLAGGVPVCWASDYHAHIGATACVCEVPVGVLRYTNQWEILGLHAPRPLLCINATIDTEVFQPKHMLATLRETAARVYRLYDAESLVRGEAVQSGHDYNQPMRELFYNHAAKYVLGVESPNVVEAKDLPVEPPEALQCGLPATSENLASLTYHRAQELVAGIPIPSDQEAWQKQRETILQTLRHEVLGDWPDPAQSKATLLRRLSWNERRVEHWLLQTEPGLSLPAVLCFPKESSATPRGAVLVLDDGGKQAAFQDGVVERLSEAGWAVLALDVRGTGETAGTVPAFSGAHDYNLTNYANLCGRPLVGMRFYDALCAVRLLLQTSQVDPARIAVVGRGSTGLAAILAAAYEPRIAAVAAVGTLDSWVFPEEFCQIGMSCLIPRVLTVGDVGHLAAALAPRGLLLCNAIDGRGRAASSEEVVEATQFTAAVYALCQNRERFQTGRCADAEDAERITRWLNETVAQPRP